MACYIAVGWQLAVIYAILWVDRVFIGYLRIAYDLGVELVTASMILIGILYGPSFVFLFGFFVYPIVDAFRWMVATPFSPEWPPVMPSPDSAIAGLVGVVASLLTGFLPFFIAVIATLIIRIPIVVIKDWIFYEMPFKPGYIFGVPFTLMVVYALQFLVN